MPNVDVFFFSAPLICNSQHHLLATSASLHHHIPGHYHSSISWAEILGYSPVYCSRRSFLVSLIISQLLHSINKCSTSHPKPTPRSTHRYRNVHRVPTLARPPSYMQLVGSGKPLLACFRSTVHWVSDIHIHFVLHLNGIGIRGSLSREGMWVRNE
jgi:hypothetical protein